MQFSDCNDTLENIRLFVRVGLMKHTFISIAGRSRFICINTRNYKNFFFYLLLHLNKSGDIIKHTVFIICGAWTDYKHKLIRSSAQYIFCFKISRLNKLRHFSIKRIHLLDLHRNGKLPFKHHIHHKLKFPFSGIIKYRTSCS